MQQDYFSKSTEKSRWVWRWRASGYRNLSYRIIEVDHSQWPIRYRRLKCNAVSYFENNLLCNFFKLKNTNFGFRQKGSFLESLPKKTARPASSHRSTPGATGFSHPLNGQTNDQCNLLLHHSPYNTGIPGVLLLLKFRLSLHIRFQLLYNLS